MSADKLHSVFFKHYGGVATLKLYLLTLILFFSSTVFSQNYTYQDYLHDREKLKVSNRFIREDKIDSLELNLSGYKDRLGFTYFQYKALTLAYVSDSNSTKYLDSAFMRGMTPTCLGKHLKKFDSAYVYTSFIKNYLKAYNPNLVNLVDSIHQRDQRYRRQITLTRNSPDEPPQKRRVLLTDQKNLN